ncbi:MAG: hypothetical protein E5X07_15920 [Mesorhizobium sp.]|uniref:hypothetical protein n=1 Tax=Mesorhizobium sp. TaxID=1871066 RepID=UPI00122722E0|nr:hypothetical protein [Mesorhizobium sp.]TIR28755.1 MAG: hypothetical protein E5X35_29515 [Mesorhizobium sp.]TIS23845.1 MAG: hypothetical protein E5X07_15920 [Mesorhizobium sp.]
MGMVISLEEHRMRRRRPPDPLQEFGSVFDGLMQAMDLIEKAPPCPATSAAYKAVYGACEKLLAREKRFYGE